MMQVACSTMTNSKDEGGVDSAEFARILTKQAVAHVCVAIGFTATSAGALDCLTDVVQRYVESMAKRTMENTYRAGRTEPNIPDVLQGFQQMRTPLSWTDLRDFAFSEDGYSDRYKKGASSGSSSSSSSGSSSSSSSSSSAAPAANGAGGARAAGGGREELPKRWDQPFHHAVPPFPMPRKRAAPWDEAEEEGEGATEGPRSRPPHIPAFMPPLPPSTSRGASAGSDRSLAEIRLERLKRQRQGETALRSLGAPGAAAGAAAAGNACAAAAAPLAAGPSAPAEGSSSGKSGGIGKIIIRLGGGGGGNGGAANGGRRTSAAGEGGGGGNGRSGSFDRGHSSDRPWQENGRTTGPPVRGFRKLMPNAAGASARSSGGASAVDGENAAAAGEGGAAAGGGGLGLGDGVKARVLKGFAGGGRGAFGRSSDSTREDRILEGMPPDGTADTSAV